MSKVSYREGTWLYFIQADEDGPVKVGTAINPVGRMAGFQTGNHHQLHLRRKVWIHPLSEREIHSRVLNPSLRIRNEWYEPSVLDSLIPLERMFGVSEPERRRVTA